MFQSAPSQEETQTKESMLLCEAVIEQHVSDSKQQQQHPSSSIDGRMTIDNKQRQVHSREERVNVSEDALEGVRRSVLSMTECNLSVLELCLAMPWLPRNSDKNFILQGADVCHNSVSSEELMLCADRAALRLLEDALFDACEKEGEEDMLDDLNLDDDSKLDNEDAERLNQNTLVATAKMRNKKKLKRAS
mmetsp:Transcript_52825/g.78319  ORF Transcript_52825/g.78319 Transcript_52825/m.78319 type:complete len:191 (+) Transcript_52825:417-989(+)